MQDAKKIEALAKELAKGLKTEKDLSALAAQFQISDEDLPKSYLDALEWASQSFKGTST